ncbi:F-box domain [Dillenia turbinata]|uniref:F-box domain n=1 Tax=Dillenia turbinata TaxID=194707 RepID=A0AAN8Z9U8_9MAGN
MEVHEEPVSTTLPEELIIEILSRLPAKSVLRFRCVCKSWKSLFSEPEFVQKHLHMSNSNTHFKNHKVILNCADYQFLLKSCCLYNVLNEPSEWAFPLEYSLKGTDYSIVVVGSCNGLVCIVFEQIMAYIWNPSIRESKRLPDLGLEPEFRSISTYGFGFDHSHDDYKVVSVFSTVEGFKRKTEVTVYSLRSNSWKRIEDFPCGFPTNETGKFLSGQLHFVAFDNVDLASPLLIVSLDLASEAYNVVPLPVYDRDLELSLGVLGEHLCAICNYHSSHADIWLMKEYNWSDSWIKLMTVEFSDENLFLYAKPLCLTKSDEILFDHGGAFSLYDLKKNLFRYLRVYGSHGCLESGLYVESLVSILGYVDDGVERH